MDIEKLVKEFPNDRTMKVLYYSFITFVVLSSIALLVEYFTK